VLRPRTALSVDGWLRADQPATVGSSRSPGQISRRDV
jgi:hypothetical protein